MEFGKIWIENAQSRTQTVEKWNKTLCLKMRPTVLQMSRTWRGTIRRTSGVSYRGALHHLKKEIMGIQFKNYMSLHAYKMHENIIET